MVPLTLSEAKYLLRTGCCAQPGTAPCFVIDLLRKSLCHRDHKENESFSKVSVDSVAAQGNTYARCQIEFRNKDMTLALQATDITKRFPGVLANDHVNFFPWKEVKFKLSWVKMALATRRS